MNCLIHIDLLPKRSDFSEKE